jgi:multisubunit Na+/H+ antiporter MnhG subunit
MGSFWMVPQIVSMGSLLVAFGLVLVAVGSIGLVRVTGSMIRRS